MYILIKLLAKVIFMPVLILKSKTIALIYGVFIFSYLRGGATIHLDKFGICSLENALW